MKLKCLLTGFFVLYLFTLNFAQKSHKMMDNPLLKKSDLPFGAPNFTEIKNSDFLPAIQYAMDMQSQEVKSIASSKSSPTFENTMVALEKSGDLLSRVNNVFFALTGANTNDELKEIQSKVIPMLSAHSDAILLNSDLFKRIDELYQKRNDLKLDKESLRLLEVTHQEFVKSGAKLDDDHKMRLKEINSRMATLQNDFNQLLLDANNASAFLTEKKTELKGLSDGELESYIDKNGYKIPIQNTTQQPILSSLDEENTRKDLFRRSWDRTDSGEFSTKKILASLAMLRAEKAQLLGFKNYAEWNLQDTMVKTPETVFNFFNKIIPPTILAIGEEQKVLQDFVKESDKNKQLQPWDWMYYSDKLRQKEYDINDAEVKPYFELKTVLEDGVFFAATKLYGLTFKPRTDIPVYHPDVMVYEVYEENGDPLGLFYGDYFARESKRGGAWMSNFVDQSYLLEQKPVIYNVCNFTKPAEGQPSLISFDDVETMFHEFGHALHGFFANQKYPSLSGTSVARDFVEYPSQANEHWATDPTVLKNYARHYKTGALMPKQLLEKIERAKNFNQGFAFGEVLEAAYLDMKWHSISAAEKIKNVDEFEKNALESKNLWIKNVPPRYRSTYFAHIFGGGYAAGYYAYLWTEMLAKDTGKWFDENGGLSRKNGDRYRKMILSIGNTRDYKEAYLEFRGKEPQADAILQSRGLLK